MQPVWCFSHRDSLGQVVRLLTVLRANLVIHFTFLFFKNDNFPFYNFITLFLKSVTANWVAGFHCESV